MIFIKSPGWLRFLGTLFLAGVLFGGDPSSREAIAADRQDILEGAKKEGEFLFYSGMIQSDTDALFRKFMEKYPFINAKFYTTPTDKLIVKILEELRVGKLPADVIQMGGVLTEVINQHGGMGNYVSPELKGIPDEFKDPKGLWGSSYITLNVLGYNTRLVKGNDIPKSYQDLLDPKWKGKMSFTSNELRWFIAQLGIMGEEKGLQFMQKLSAQNLKIYPSKSVTSTLLAAGEVSIDVNSRLEQLERLKKAGAAVDWIAINPVYTGILPIFITRTAPHPNAGKLFVDFILSREGQTVLRSLKQIPTRRDVPPDPSQLLQGMTFYPDKMDTLNRFDEFNKMYKSILLTKRK